MTITNQGKPTGTQVDNDSDLSPGSLIALAGFPSSIVGYSGVGGFNNYTKGSRVLARSSGRLFEIGEDTGGNKVAVMITAGLVALPNVLYVDAASPSGGNGTLSLPFNTIQAALNAALAGTLIYVAPGTYTENLVIPDKDNLAIMGASRGNTIIQNSGDNHTITWVRGPSSAATPITTFAMSEPTIKNNAVTASKRAIYFDASTENVFPPNLARFCTNFCAFEYIDIERSGPVAGECTYFNRLSYVFLRACRWYGTPATLAANDSVAGTTTVINCSKFELHDSSILTSADFTYSRLLPAPTGGRDQYAIAEASAIVPIQTNFPRNQGWCIIRAHPILIVDATSGLTGSQNAAGTTQPALQGVGLTSVGAGAYGPGAGPIVICQGYIGNGSVPTSGRVDLPMPSATAVITAQGGGTYLDFTRASFTALAAAGTAVITITSATLASALPFTLSMRQCVFNVLDSATLGGLVNGIRIGSATAGLTNTINADIRQSSYSLQTQFQINGTSTLDRTSWSIGGNLTVLAGSVTVSPPYPTGATYNVSVEPAALASFAITAKTVSSFTQQGSAGVSATFTLARS